MIECENFLCVTEKFMYDIVKFFVPKIFLLVRKIYPNSLTILSRNFPRSAHDMSMIFGATLYRNF